MRLIDLEAQFYKHSVGIADKILGRPLEDGSVQWGGFPVDQFGRVDDLAQADRVMFLCPVCLVTNNGKAGTHRIAIDFACRGTPDTACIHNSAGQPVRWEVLGTGLDDLTLHPSVLVIGCCNWHGWVKNGEATNT